MKVVASGVKVIVANSIVWWLLMIVDDRWWSLMIVDGDVRYDTSELGKASQSHRWNYFQNHPLPKCSTEGTSLPTKGSWCVSLNGPVVSSSSPCWSFNPMQCWSKVQCAGTDLFADPSLLLAVLLRFDSPPCLSARGGPRRPSLPAAAICSEWPTCELGKIRGWRLPVLSGFINSIHIH